MNAETAALIEKITDPRPDAATIAAEALTSEICPNKEAAITIFLTALKEAGAAADCTEWGPLDNTTFAIRQAFALGAQQMYIFMQQIITDAAQEVQESSV